ncbi:hypothetical protein KKG48_02135 [Patescibacteria group bacterium]|nr:hypothetical protein [Patescibacteria group bacterium]MCG2695209.1 hypothetical protein [Candidatus Parcubacteria bacterium]
MSFLSLFVCGVSAEINKSSTLIIKPPTVIVVNNSSVKMGDDFEVSGYSSPDSKIEIKINDIIESEVMTDNSGFYSVSLDTKKIGSGIHYVKAREISESSTSGFSVSRAFKIFESEKILKADFNNDGVTNPSDWNIFLFRWGSEDLKLQDKIDLNKDGKVDVTDFSIFLKQIKFQSIK